MVVFSPSFSAASSSLYKEPAMFHHCNHPIRFGHFEHLELPRRCIVTWHLLAVNSKLVENFEPSSEYTLWCWQQRKIVSEYSQLACEWFLPWQEIRLYSEYTVCFGFICRCTLTSFNNFLTHRLAEERLQNKPPSLQPTSHQSHQIDFHRRLSQSRSMPISP